MTSAISEAYINYSFSNLCCGDLGCEYFGGEEFDGMNELYSVFAKVDDLRAILLGHGHGRDAFNKYIHYPQNIRKRI